jgi:hypothetical protein
VYDRYMSTLPEFETMADDQLLMSVRKIVARTNTGLADLLAHLAEVEVRGIHRQRACASLYTYCVYELRMSEDEASRRSKAARLVRQFPELFERIAKGELHLTGLLLLGPHLDCERRQQILDCARFRSKREIQELVSRLSPKPDVSARVEPIGPASAGPATHHRFASALAPTIRSLPVGDRPADSIEGAGDGPCAEHPPADSSDDGDAGIDPALTAHANANETHWAAPVRFKVQFTATEEYVSSMNEECPTQTAACTTQRISRFVVERITCLRQSKTSGGSTWRMSGDLPPKDRAGAEVSPHKMERFRSLT